MLNDKNRSKKPRTKCLSKRATLCFPPAKRMLCKKQARSKSRPCQKASDRKGLTVPIIMLNTCPGRKRSAPSCERVRSLKTNIGTTATHAALQGTLECVLYACESAMPVIMSSIARRVRSSVTALRMALNAASQARQRSSSSIVADLPQEGHLIKQASSIFLK